MFGSRKYNVDMLGKVKPTSKFGLKQQCLCIANFNVENAERLYDFLAKDLKDLPDLDVVPPSTMETIRTTAGSVFGWIKDNKDDVLQLGDFIRGLVKGKSVDSAPPIPPINE